MTPAHEHTREHTRFLIDALRSDPDATVERLATIDLKSTNTNEWFCEHCGEYFPAVADVCPCGAVVNPEVGVAQVPDGHRWLPPGAPECQECVLAFVRRVADLDKYGEQLTLDDEGCDDPFDALHAIISEARTLLGRPIDRPGIVDVVVVGDVL
jgi:hypothetical protein